MYNLGGELAELSGFSSSFYHTVQYLFGGADNIPNYSPSSQQKRAIAIALDFFYAFTSESR
jgi:hypothetical protein